jgi:hypothetical protein
VSLKPGANLIRREVLPFGLSLLLLVAAALVVDAVLHMTDQVWIGRWLGIPGLVLILGSFGYSLRKRKLISRGNPAVLLRYHERMSWAGSLLILVHAGIHFNAVLPWLAVAAMLVNVTSGLTGKYLLRRARLRLESARQALADDGLSPAEVEQNLYRDSLTLDFVKRWRVVHIPITLAFAILASAHLISTAIFWDWQ